MSDDLVGLDPDVGQRRRHRAHRHPGGYGLPARPLVTATVPVAIVASGSTSVTSSGTAGSLTGRHPEASDGTNCTPTLVRRVGEPAAPCDWSADTSITRPTRPPPDDDRHPLRASPRRAPAVDHDRELEIRLRPGDDPGRRRAGCPRRSLSLSRSLRSLLVCSEVLVLDLLRPAAGRAGRGAGRCRPSAAGTGTSRGRSR